MVRENTVFSRPQPGSKGWQHLRVCPKDLVVVDFCRVEDAQTFRRASTISDFKTRTVGLPSGGRAATAGSG